MNKLTRKFVILAFILFYGAFLSEGRIYKRSESLECRQEKHRPQLHWSVLKNWANDPNGMVYYDGEFHLYWQYDPYSLNGGPKHWGHSVSSDMFNWSDLPIALYPDPLGDIWSGSAVMDFKNISGFQTDPDTPPMIAFFTHAGAIQQQSIAYSLNRGVDYTKYDQNPVVPNPGGIRDFRDPKVFQYDEENWVMVLAAGHKISFYGSKDFKNWEFLSDFGEEPPQGAHESVWECPDLLHIRDEGTGFRHWVLLVSLGGGGPNGPGSGTQYFVGDFDGRTFTSAQFDPLWIDQGKDNYAGVTFSNDPRGRHILMGWMVNLAYAGQIPTGEYLGQMTLPRALTLVTVGQDESCKGKLRLKSTVVQEFDVLRIPGQYYDYSDRIFIAPNEVFKLSEILDFSSPLQEINVRLDISGLKGLSSLAICFVNNAGEELCTGLDHMKEPAKKLFMNRERTGNNDEISSAFTGRLTAGREINDPLITFRIILDWSALEVFVDGGLTTFTSLFYPRELLDRVEIRHHAGSPDSQLLMTFASVQGLKSIYDCNNQH